MRRIHWFSILGKSGVRRYNYVWRDANSWRQVTAMENPEEFAVEEGFQDYIFIEVNAFGNEVGTIESVKMR